MKKYSYCLCITFDIIDCEEFYSGASFYRKNLIDHIDIYENSIKLFFTRSATHTIEDCLYKPNTPTHFEIQRALTYYLAVKGSIPEVKSITLRERDSEKPLRDMSYTAHWSNCSVQLTYEKEVAARIFDENWRRPYIIMTYFLKAQLSRFSLDKFHAAWSCVNAYYNKFSNSTEDREHKKISMLEHEIRNRKLPLAEQRIKALGNEAFWDHLQWYIYVSRNNVAEEGKRPKLQKWLYESDHITDRKLFERLVKYVPNPDFSKEQQEEFVSRKISRYKNSFNIQIAWLICEYSYMLRNRGFHGDKPYPLFSLSDTGEGKSVENQLAEIMLLTVYDLMK